MEEFKLEEKIVNMSVTSDNQDDASSMNNRFASYELSDNSKPKKMDKIKGQNNSFENPNQ